MIRPLTLPQAEFVANTIVKELMDYENEPIPPFHTRYVGILESCLAEPFSSFGGKEFHVTFEKKAAVLFYLVIKNHPFTNGNKRMAVALTLAFCYINGRWLDVAPLKLYQIACIVAESVSTDKDKVLAMLEQLFRLSIQSIPEI